MLQLIYIIPKAKYITNFKVIIQFTERNTTLEKDKRKCNVYIYLKRRVVGEGVEIGSD